MWRHIAGSARGMAHEKSGVPCQDAYATRVVAHQDHLALVATVSDGAGSADQSHHGSRAACEGIAIRAQRHFQQRGTFELLTRDDVLAWCSGARAEISAQAKAAQRPVRDYACTLSAALVTTSHAVFFQIGDGAIVVAQGSPYGVVFWPQSGEYANSTNFLTQDDYAESLDFASCPGRFDTVALFTDGLERLALRFEGRNPHPPFFDPFFQAVREAEDLVKLNEDLLGFLSSELVQNRSDDDKTVILAAQVGKR